MELIPILSTIILVATISTFILAVGAYVLYKIRERKYQEVPAPTNNTQRAEYMEPEDLPREKIFVEDMIKPKPHVVKHGVRYSPVNQNENFYSPQYAARKERGKTRKTSSERNLVPEVPSSRYLKYTDEGYISTDKDRDNGDIKWR